MWIEPQMTALKSAAITKLYRQKTSKQLGLVALISLRQDKFLTSAVSALPASIARTFDH